MWCFFIIKTDNYANTILIIGVLIGYIWVLGHNSNNVVTTGIVKIEAQFISRPYYTIRALDCVIVGAGRGRDFSVNL
jgi:hypothetical protein